MKIFRSGIWYIDKILGGGFREEKIYEICGAPWTIIKEHIHMTLPVVASQEKVTVLYGQYFDGLDPYKIVHYSRLHKMDYSKVKNGIRLVRGFKGEDYVKALKRVARLEDIIFLIDPYLHPYTTRKVNLFGEISSKIYMFKGHRNPVIIFNRLNHNGKPLGGEFHRHIPDEIVSIRRIDGYIQVELIKSRSRPYKSFLVDMKDLYNIGGKAVQHMILEWMV